MSNLLERGSLWLDGQRHNYMTQEVTYARGTASVTLMATVGRTEFEQADDSGAITKFESRDYLLRADDLLLDDVAVVPQPGDTITEEQDGLTHSYVVCSVGMESCWRYSDRHRQTIRVHTKHTNTEAAT